MQALGGAVGAFALVAALVALQPDISQTAFLTLLFLGLLFLAGLGIQWVVLLMGAGAGSLRPGLSQPFPRPLSH